jgi:hypothetical protein
MTKIIATLVLAASIAAGVSTAQAKQGFGGEGLRAAAASGTLTPHGSFDR